MADYATIVRWLAVLDGAVPDPAELAAANSSLVGFKDSAPPPLLLEVAQRLFADAASTVRARHYGLQCFASVVQSNAMPPDRLHAVTLGMLSSARGLNESAAIKRTMAAVAAAVALQHFPQRWPTFISDMLAVAAKGESGGELCALVLCEVADTASASASQVTSKLPKERRSEVLQGLTATAGQYLPVLLPMLQSCLNTAAGGGGGGGGGAAAPPAARVAALTVALSLLELLSALITFLPSAVLRELHIRALLRTSWSSLASMQSARVEGGSGSISMVDRGARAVTACLAATAAHKWAAPGEEPLQLAAVQAAVDLLLSTDSVGWHTAALPSVPKLSVGYADYRQLVYAAGEVLARHLPPLLARARAAAAAAAAAASAAPAPDAAAAVEAVTSCLRLLLQLLGHPSVLVRCAAAGSLSSTLQHSQQPVNLPGGGAVATALLPRLLVCLEKEARFSRSDDSAAGAGVAAAAAAAAEAAHADSAAASAEERESYEARQDDFADDDQDKYDDDFASLRASVTRCVTALVAAYPAEGVAVLEAAAKRARELAATKDHPTQYGTCSAASSGIRALDGLGVALETVLAAVPAEQLPRLQAPLRSVTATLLSTLAPDALLRARQMACIKHMHRLLAADRELLQRALGAVFETMAFPNPPPLSRGVMPITERGSMGGAGAGAGVSEEAAAHAALTKDAHFARQSACQALVFIARKMPSVLLPQLDQLKHAVDSALKPKTSLLSPLDRTSLAEALLLVSNALARGPPERHAAVVRDLVQPTLDSLRAPEVLAALASPVALIDYLCILEAKNRIALATKPTNTFVEAVPPPWREHADSILQPLHALWAMARRCSAVEMAAACAVDLRASASASAANGGAGAGGGGGGGSALGDTVDIPAHPFNQFWSDILPIVLQLIHVLHSLFAMDTAKHLLMVPPQTVKGTHRPLVTALAASGRYLLALSEEEAQLLRNEVAATEATAEDADGGAGGAGASGGAGGMADSARSAGGGGRSRQSAVAAVVRLPVLNGLRQVGYTPWSSTPDFAASATTYSAWASRCLWHAYSLLSMAARAHLPQRPHACALSALSGAHPHGQVVDMNDHLALRWAPVGLYSMPICGPAWKQLHASFSPAILDRLPLRVYRMIFQQLLPGLIEGCPPSMHIGGQTLRMLLYRVSFAADARVRHSAAVAVAAAATSPAASAGGAMGGSVGASASGDAGSELDVDFGLLPLGRITDRTLLAAMRDRVRQAVIRAQMDCIAALLPPREAWYGLVKPADAPAAPPSPPPPPPPPGSRVMSISGIRFFAVPTDACPVVARSCLFPLRTAGESEDDDDEEAEAGGRGRATEDAGAVTMPTPLCTPLMVAIRHGDSVTLQRAIDVWSRLLCCLHPRATASDRCGGLWRDAAVHFFSAGIEALCLGAPHAAPCEADLIALLTDIYARFQYGLPATVSGALQPHAAANGGAGAGAGAGGGAGGGSPAVASGARHPLGQGPHQYLASCRSVSRERRGEFQRAFESGVSERERKQALTAFLRDLAAVATPEALGVMAPVCPTAVRPGPAPAVRNLPERLVLAGRASGGRGGGRHPDMGPGVLEQARPSGLDALFGDPSDF